MNLSSYALYPHQVEGVEFLARRGRAILGDDMNLNETRQTGIARKASAASGVLRLTRPASLKLNWAREMRLVDPDARIEVLAESGHEQPQCTCPGFEYRGECKHVRDVRKTALAN